MAALQGSARFVTDYDGCIECRHYLLQIVVCEYDAILCKLLCKVSWYTLQFIHFILGLILHYSDFAVVL